MELQKIVAETDFDHNKDREEFGCDDRIVYLDRFNDVENQDMLAITFKLRCGKDSSISLVLPYEEFTEKVASLTTLEP